MAEGEEEDKIQNNSTQTSSDVTDSVMSSMATAMRSAGLGSMLEETPVAIEEEKEVSTSKFIKTNNKTEIINNLINDMSVINLDALSPKEALDKLYTYVKKIKELE